MKKHLLFIAVLCFSTLFCAGQDTFFNVYDDWNVLKGQAVIPTENGYYIYTYGGYLGRFNQLGDRLWTKRIDTGVGPYMTYAERDEKGNLYFTSNNEFTKIIKTDSLGTTISTTSFDYGSTKKMIKLTNGNFIMLCQSGKDLALLTIDTAGTEQWNATLTAPGNDSLFYPIDLIEMPDGKICVIIDIGDDGNYVYHLYTFSSNGDFIKKMGLFDLDPDFFVIRSVIGINDEELIYAGENDNSFWRSHEIGKINVSSGNVIWRKPIFNDVFYARQIFAGSKGDTLYIAGTIQLTALYQKQVLTAAINKEGELLWMNHQGYRTKYEVFNARLCPDGGLAVTGECSTSKCFLLKTDDEGTTETLSLPQKQENTHIGIYPNPVKDFAYILSSTPVMKIELIDSQGRLIISYHPDLNPPDRIPVPVSDLSNGIYFIRITDIKRRVSVHKLVK